MASGSVTVAGTGSLILIQTAVTFNTDSGDTGCYLAIFVDGSMVTEAQSGVDNTGNEPGFVFLAWAETGLSTGSHDFDIRWKEDSGQTGCIIDVQNQRHVQVIEFLSADIGFTIKAEDISIIADGTATTSFTDLDDLTESVTVVADSIYLTLATISVDDTAGSSDDVSCEFALVIDGTIVTTTKAWSDATTEGGNAFIWHWESGLTAGAKVFKIQWKEEQEQCNAGPPGDGTVVQRAMQVIEFTGTGVPTILNENREASTQEMTTTETDLTGMDFTPTIAGTDSLVFMSGTFNNGQSGSDSECELQIRAGGSMVVDGARYTDGTNEEGSITLAWVETGVSGSRNYDLQGSESGDNSSACSGADSPSPSPQNIFQIVEFVPASGGPSPVVVGDVVTQITAGGTKTATKLSGDTITEIVTGETKGYDIRTNDTLSTGIVEQVTRLQSFVRTPFTVLTQIVTGSTKTVTKFGGDTITEIVDDGFRGLSESGADTITEIVETAIISKSVVAGDTITEIVETGIPTATKLPSDTLTEIVEGVTLRQTIVAGDTITEIVETAIAPQGVSETDTITEIVETGTKTVTKLSSDTITEIVEGVTLRQTIVAGDTITEIVEIGARGLNDSVGDTITQIVETIVRGLDSIQADTITEIVETKVADYDKLLSDTITEIVEVVQAITGVFETDVITEIVETTNISPTKSVSDTITEIVEGTTIVQTFVRTASDTITEIVEDTTISKTIVAGDTITEIVEQATVITAVTEGDTITEIVEGTIISKTVVVGDTITQIVEDTTIVPPSPPVSTGGGGGVFPTLQITVESATPILQPTEFVQEELFITWDSGEDLVLEGLAWSDSPFTFKPESLPIVLEGSGGLTSTATVLYIVQAPQYTCATTFPESTVINCIEPKIYDAPLEITANHLGVKILSSDLTNVEVGVDEINTDYILIGVLFAVFITLMYWTGFTISKRKKTKKREREGQLKLPALEIGRLHSPLIHKIPRPSKKTNGIPKVVSIEAIRRMVKLEVKQNVKRPDFNFDNNRKSSNIAKELQKTQKRGKIKIPKQKSSSKNIAKELNKTK